MSTKPINLLPRAIHTERLRQRLARRWIMACGLCLLLAVGAVVLGGGKHEPPDTATLQARLDATVRQKDQLIQQIASATQTTESLRRDLASSQQVMDQPDLALLLQLVGQQLGSEAMLTRCRIGTGKEQDIRAAVGPGQHDPAQRWLVVSGIAADHQAVPAIVLRLEGLGLFDQVIMNQTWTETYNRLPRVGFRIACRMPSVAEEGVERE